MLTEIIYTLPEIILLAGIFHIFILYMVDCDKAKTYAFATRFWLLASTLIMVCFYDKNINNYPINKNAYTLLCGLCLNSAVYIMLLLSPIWFSALKRLGGRYNILIILATACLSIMLKVTNLGLLIAGEAFLLLINNALIRTNYEKKQSEVIKRHTFVSLSVFILSLAGGIYLWYQAQGKTDFEILSKVLIEQEKSLWTFLAIMGIFVPFLYMLGIVPFHTMAEDKNCKNILPVSHYFAIIIPIAAWGMFIKLNQLFIPIYGQEMSLAYKILALITIVFGAVGASARINLHRIYAYATMYQFGAVLLLFSLFTPSAQFVSFIYLLVYMTALYGAYIVFYNLKSHGEYLSSVTSLSGLAKIRPYTASALIIVLFSMMGLPPMAGFLGQLNMVYEFIKSEHYVDLFIALVSVVLLAKAFLNIVKTIYFEQKIKMFDTENKYILLYTWTCVIFILFLLFNPWNVIEKAKDMFYVVFL